VVFDTLNDERFERLFFDFGLKTPRNLLAQKPDLLHFWEHTNSTFLKRYEKLFDSDGDTPPVFKHGRGMLAMLEDVAEVQIFGNIKNVYEQNVHNVFMYLEHKKVKVEQAEKAQRDADRRNNLNND